MVMGFVLPLRSGNFGIGFKGRIADFLKTIDFMFKFLKKKNKGKHANSNRYFELKIKEVRKETGDTNTLVFEKPDRPFHYQPGQFLTLILPIDNKEVRRSYSLCTSPYSDENPAITVKRVESGIVSNYLNDHMKAGDTFEVMEAAGHFVAKPSADQKKKYLLFAAGSGITPIMSIIKSIFAVETESDITLVYQNRNESSIIFQKELADIKSKYVDRFIQVDLLSQPTTEWKGQKGRINASKIHEALEVAGIKNMELAEYFLCGPTGFMQIVHDVLIELKAPEHNIHKESFYSGEANATAKITDETAFDVEMILDGESHTVHVPAKKSILDAALDQGLDMPFSCQSGFCTACRGKLLEGKVDMNEDEGLSEEEKEEGYILNCVSHPAGPGVKIEVG